MAGLFAVVGTTAARLGGARVRWLPPRPPV